MPSILVRFCGLIWLVIPQLGLAGDSNFDIKRVDASTISYTGGIVSGKSFVALEDALTDATTTLIVRSHGGDLHEGLRMGALIAARKLNVEVDAYCLSSCANNIFLAGYSKRLRAGAVLGFHGAMNTNQGQIDALEVLSEADLRSSLEKKNLYFNDLAVREWQFLRELKLAPNIHVALVNKLEAALPPNKVDWIVTLGGKRYTVSDGADSRDRILKLIRRKLMRQPKLLKSGLEITRQNPYGDALFFPRQSTLEKFGVREIVEYPYPNDASELGALTKGLMEKYDFAAIRVAGEFDN